jgi:hypothetical protein
MSTKATTKKAATPYEQVRGIITQLSTPAVMREHEGDWYVATEKGATASKGALVCVKVARTRSIRFAYVEEAVATITVKGVSYTLWTSKEADVLA